MALDFFYSMINEKASSLIEAFQLLQRQFNSYQHQAQARLYLNNLSVDNVRKEKSCSDMMALEIIHQRILDTAPSCGTEFQGDAHKQEFLVSEVKECSWASPVLQARLTPSNISELYDYNTLYSKLTTALTANGIFGKDIINSQPKMDTTSPILYGSRYAKSQEKKQFGRIKRNENLNIKSMLRPPNRIKPRMSASELQQLKKKTKCLRCGEIGHWRNECPNKHKAPLRVVMLQHIEELGNDNTAVAKTLLAFAEEEEEYECYYTQTRISHNSDPPEEISNSFEALLNECGEDTYEEEHAHNDLQRIMDSFSKLEHFFSWIKKNPKSNDNKRLFNGKTFIKENVHSNVPFSMNSLEFFENSQQEQFQGALLDTGAQRSVIGIKQAILYCIFAGINFKLSPSLNSFSFGAGKSKSIGSITILIPTPGSLIRLSVDVIKNNIPFLVGLDVLDENSLQVLTVENLLQSVKEKWKCPTVRKYGHVYYDWKYEFSYFLSKPQLERLHHHFMHPSVNKLYDLLCRSGIDNVTLETRKIIKEICDTCEPCQVYKKRQLHFRVRENDEIRFYQSLLIDKFYIEGNTSKKIPVIHIVDSGTHFQNAAFLKNMDASTVWNTFLKIWAGIYVGFPETLLTDQGSVFVSNEWKYNCELAKIELLHTGTESHNSLGAGETYHDILRRVNMKTRAKHKDLPLDVCLTLALKAINSTVGPNGLCPQLLVFGILPKIPDLTSKKIPTQRQSFLALSTARKEYEKIVASKIVKRGLNKIPPTSTNHVYAPGDFVYVYSEGLKHYTGPHMIAEVSEKHVRVHLGERTGPRQFNISQLRPVSFSEQNEFFKSGINCQHLKILWTETLAIGDPRENQFDEAKRKETLGLIERGTFRVVLAEEVGEKPNIIPSRFVLAIKHADNGSTKLKARFVVGGHLDKEKKQ